MPTFLCSFAIISPQISLTSKGIFSSKEKGSFGNFYDSDLGRIKGFRV
jgi:hypothetical protein